MLFAQVNYSANDQVPTYTGKFLAGVNPGYYGGNWTNFELTDLCAGNAAVDINGAGVRAIRGTLPEHFGIVWDYNNWIPVYEYYDALGIKDNTLVVGVAHPDHSDPIDYCPSDPTKTTMFANLYEPIWDGGANGTAINENNYMAKYVYDLIHTVGDHVKFWEVWNEPGFDLSGYKSSLQPGEPGNWWENDPDPCDIIIRAPIQNYIRTLRITYEVVKTYSPDDFVVVSGLGTDAFLDALMRNTDNPNGGQVTADFPLKSGAYFDVIGFHAYPSIDGSIRYWDNNTGGFIYSRHSDGAVEGFNTRVEDRKNLLGTYGYDGITYPEKLLIVTEIDVPRLPFGNAFGSDELQKNYIMKTVEHATRIGILQTHVWQLAERTTVANANGSFDVMGFFENINDLVPGEAQILPQGIAHATVSTLLADATFSLPETNSLNLPSGVKGGAYQRTDGTYIYMLWARTNTDLSEVASANYSFPASYGNNMNAQYWDYSQTSTTNTVSSQNINLTGTPVFFTLSGNTGALTMNCPAGNLIEIPAQQSAGGAIVNWANPTATTTCPGGNVTITSKGGASGDFFPFGATVVSYEATDDCGNTKRCAMRVAVASTGGINTTCHINLWDFKFAGQRDGHKYFISKFKRNYQEAVAVAASYGAKLLSIETQAENDFLRYQFTDVGYIGLNDAQTEGNLIWESGEPVTFTSFDDCSWCLPNNAANDFAEFHPWNAKWSFTDGTVPQFFMMEFDCGDPAPTAISLTSFPSNILMTVDNGTNVSWAPPTAATTCAGVVSITQIAGPSSGSYFAATGSPVVITYSFTDNCNNTLQQSFTVTISQESSGGCPSSIFGYSKLGEFLGHGYYMSNDSKPFSEAKILSENQAGYLATMNNQVENDFLQSKLNNQMVFIGFNDATIEGAGQWANNEPVTLDLSYNNSSENDYAVMNFWAGTWQLVSSAVHKRYVLEKVCGGSTGESNLVVSGVICPDSYPLPGSQFPVTVTISNQGAAASIAKPLYFYQKNSTNNGGAINLSFGTFLVPVIEPGESVTLSKNFTLENSFLPGSYSNVGNSYPLNYGDFGFSFEESAVMGNANDAQTLDYYCKKYNTDLKIDLLATNPTFDDAGVLDYQVVVTNNGGQAAYNIRASVLNNLFPNGTSMSANVIISPSAIIKYSPSGIYWYIESLPAGESLTVSVHYVLPADFVANATEFPLSTFVWSGHNDNSNTLNDTADFTFVKTGSGNNCPPTIQGYSTLGEYNGHKYYLSNNEDNWLNNKSLAEANGGHLVVVNDAAENAFLKNMISELVHIGFSDDASEGQVQWVNGDPINYTNYSDCDWCGLNTSTNDYGLLLFWDGKWSFDHPWAARKSIMEMDCGNTSGNLPDLTVSNITNLPANVLPGAAVDFNFDLNNSGNSTATGSYNISTYLSLDASFSVDDIVMSNIPTGGTPVGTISSVPNTIAIPNTVSGNYYLLIVVDADDSILESNENNNTVSQSILVGTGSGGCPSTISGFTKLGEHAGHGYYLSQDVANWNQAMTLTQHAGGYLTTINNVAENNYILSQIDDFVLIGLNDAALEGQLSWQSGSSSYNNLDGTNSANNDFGIMNFWNGGWSMVNQWVAKEYVMEMTCGAAQPVSPRAKKGMEKQFYALYPNPANDLITIRLMIKAKQHLSFQVYDFMGQEVLSQKENSAKGPIEVSLDISQLPEGQYFVRVTGEQLGSVLRFVKQ